MRASFVLAFAALLSAAPLAAQQGPRIAHQSTPGRSLSPAVQVGNTYYLSGKLGATRETREMTEGRTAAETRNIMESFGELLTELGLDYGDIVQGTVYLTRLEDFREMNEVYGSYFPSEAPARVTVQVAGLVSGAVVEIAFIAVKTN